MPRAGCGFGIVQTLVSILAPTILKGDLLMGRNAEAFMEQICYWWTNLADINDKVKYMDKTVAGWDRLGKPQESGAVPVQPPTSALRKGAKRHMARATS